MSDAILKSKMAASGFIKNRLNHEKWRIYATDVKRRWRKWHNFVVENLRYWFLLFNSSFLYQLKIILHRAYWKLSWQQLCPASQNARMQERSAILCDCELVSWSFYLGSDFVFWILIQIFWFWILYSGLCFTLFYFLFFVDLHFFIYESPIF